MKEIIQLEKEEFIEIQQLASHNKEEIEKLAEKMYKEKGLCCIKLSMDIKEDYNYYDSYSSFKFYNYADTIDYGCATNDYKKPFEMSYEDKQKLIKFVTKKADTMMQRKFGKQITDVNHYNKKIKELEATYKQLKIFTITGWGVAVILTLIALLK